MRPANYSFRRSLKNVNQHIALLAGLSAATATVVSAATRPNILVVMVDDMGWSDLGCYGGEIHTPVLDSLAASGLRFRQFYNSARCSPTRIALMTGLHMQTAAVSPNAGLPALRTDNNVTMPEILDAHGYRTYFAGKWHLGFRYAPGSGEPLLRDPVSRGFHHAFGRETYADRAGGDYWGDGVEYCLVSTGDEIQPIHYGPGAFYKPDALGDYALRYLDHHYAHGDGAPFFMYIAFNAPHFKLQAPSSVIDLYTDVGQDPGSGHLEKIYRYEAGWDVTRQLRHERQIDEGVIDARQALPPMSPHPSGNQAGTVPPPWDTLPPDYRDDLARRMATYAAMVHIVDENVGRMVNRLLAEGELDNTIIFFLSDNGGTHEGGVFGSTQQGSVHNGSFPLTGERLNQMGQMGEPLMNLGAGWANVNNTPLRLFKRFTHEGGIRTPLIVHWPDGIPTGLNGGWTDERGHVIDLLPTLLDITGFDHPPANPAGYATEPLEGLSLLPVLRGRTLPPRDLVIEHEENRAFYRGKWKLVTKNFNHGEADTPEHALELYNMETDPSEINNLAFHRTELLAEMAAAFNAWVDSKASLNSNRRVHIPELDTNAYAMPTGNELFFDTFNRADSTDMDASRDGLSGIYAGIYLESVNDLYYAGHNPANTRIINNRLRMAEGPAMSEVGTRINFVGDEILAAGGFSVELTIIEIQTEPRDDRYGGFGVGLDATRAAAGGNLQSADTFRGRSDLANGVADYFIDLDVTGHVNVWIKGVLVESVYVGAPEGTLLASFRTPDGFAEGDLVHVDIYFNGLQIDINSEDPGVPSRAFTWSRNQANHIGLSARGTGYVDFDNFIVRPLPLHHALAGTYALQSGLTGSQTDRDMDPDGDGLTNLEEWIWGGNPFGYSSGVDTVHLEYDAATDAFNLRHRQLTGAEQLGVHYQIHYTAQLGPNRTEWPVVEAATANRWPVNDRPTHEDVLRSLPTGLLESTGSLFFSVTVSVD